MSPEPRSIAAARTPSSWRRHRDTVRRAIAARRRLIAALLAVTAVASTVAAARPAAAPTVPAVVVADDLPAGHVLTVADVSTLEVPPDLVPAGAVEVDDVPVGRLVSGPLRQGTVLTDAAVLAPSLLAGHPPGTVLATVRVVDPAATVAVRTGDEVSVVAAGLTGSGSGGGATVVADRVRVVAMPDSADGRSPSGTGPPVLLAVDEPTALLLAEAAVASQLSLVLEAEAP